MPGLPSCLARKLRALHVSRPAVVADLNAAAFDNDGNELTAFSIPQHPSHRVLILDHIEIVEWHSLTLIVRTGLRGKRSGIFPENQYFLLHIASMIWITWSV